MKVILVTGGFDPLHSGHIAYFNAASTLGDKLVVGLNSDDWLSRKKGQQFMPFDERATIVKSLSVVDEVISFDDADDTVFVFFLPEAAKKDLISFPVVYSRVFQHSISMS